MIKRYLSTETTLDHNKYVLHPMKATVTEEANGIFELEIELPKGTQLNKRDLITAPTPRGVQPFRVYRIVKTLYGIRAYARHIFYDLANALLIDTRPTNANGNSALQSIFTAVGWSGWTYLSDITEQKTAYYIRKNPVEAIIGAENSILNVWGGNLIRDKKEVRIYADGLDRGYEIRLGKNLIGIEDDSDDSNVVTRLYPTYEKDQVIYGIPEQYVDSPLIGNYPTPITKEIRVALTDDQKGYTDEQIYQVLRDYCNNLYAVDNVDKPVVNYKVDFVELSKIARLEQEVSYNYAGLEQLTYETIETLTYEQLEGVTTIQQFLDLLEKVDLYDKVKIRVKELDIDLQARVIRYQYDALAERYIKIELGGFKNSNQYQINNIVQQMKNDREKASTEYRELYDMAINQVTGNKGGYQITRLNANNEPYETLWMDTPDIETAVNVLRINQNGIAGSANGFNGPYNVAITTDGWVVAERILANQLSAISANLGEVTTGKLRSADGTVAVDLDNKEIKVGSGTNSVNTVLKYNGMEVRDDNVMVSAFGETGAVIPTLDVGVINSRDVIQPVKEQIVYVNDNQTGYSSLQEAIDNLFSHGKRFLLGTVTIVVEKDVNENIVINNLAGGHLALRFNNNSKNYGNITVRYCSTKITIYSTDNVGTVLANGSYHGILVVSSRMVVISLINVTGGSVAIHVTEGSHVYLIDCDTGSNAPRGILAEHGSIVNVYNTKGSNSIALEARTGSIIFTQRKIGQGTLVGHIISKDLQTEPSSFQAPVVTDKIFTRVFSAATFDTLVHGTASVDSYYGAAAAQNRWDSSMGWKDGRIRLGGEVYNFFNGGTAISIRMRLRRKSTTHGNSGAVYPAPYNHSASFPSGAVRGGWTGWATVPSSLFTAGGATLTYYNGVQGSAGYAIWDAIEVEVTVTKNV